MEKTKLYERLPSYSGVTFQGFEDIILESREKVRMKLETFIEYCEKDAKRPMVAAIIGEWGEGKTAAFELYIAPRAKKSGNSAFIIVASSLSNVYESELYSRFLQKTNSSALRLLVAILLCVQEKYKAMSFPSITNFSTLSDYVSSVMQSIFGDKRRTVFVFIDEF
ncbi:MAG TPA: hypothetical protein ENF87_01455 [Thermoproteales archaeon]|nr:hypothetical protein [Thermoproteales archaeon]